MRKLFVTTFVTLDGVMQAPGGPEEDTSGGFKYGGWSFHYWDEMMGNIMDEVLNRPFELLLGRKTYEIFAAHWPHIKDDPTADKLNSVKKHVASRTLNKVDWNNSFLIKSDVVGAIKKLKNQEGPELQVHGSSNLLQTLIKHKLVDDFLLWTFPVTVGKGKRLFGDGSIPSGLELLDSHVSTTGVTITHYKAGHGLKTGSFALEEPSEEELVRRQKS
ncbi:MAG TPA: dihydrofolate reductase family protein [Balneolaceae bacterium]|nr:dihydrofolate reductase family protein [Balneolaceae bacterium]